MNGLQHEGRRAGIFVDCPSRQPIKLRQKRHLLAFEGKKGDASLDEAGFVFWMAVLQRRRAYGALATQPDESELGRVRSSHGQSRPVTVKKQSNRLAAFCQIIR
jgi:hypothetical protein